MAVLGFALLAAAVLALLVLVHRYVWRRLVGDTTTAGSLPRRAGTVAAYVLPLLSVGALVSGRTGTPFWLQQVLAWPGYLWLAALLYLTLALLAGELVRPLLSRLLARRAGDEPEAAAETVPAEPVTVAQGSTVTTAAPPAAAPLGDTPAPAAAPLADTPAPAPAAPSRRLFVARAVGGAAAVAGLGTTGYGAYGVLRGPRVKRVAVPLARLPRSAHGFRIAVVSDIHLGPVLGRAHTQRIVDAVNRTQPDLIAVVGDLVDGSVEDLGPAAEPLAGLRSRHGAFFVTGNHEYYSGAAEWVDHVRELGLHPLENSRVEIDGFDLAGVNDIAGESEGQGPDFGRALGDRDRTRAAVLMAHQPVVIDEAVEHGVDLQLSGHTHGGQLWPGNYIAELSNPTVAGLERYGDTQLYVTRGAGAWGPPVRVGAPSDITVVELASRRA
ncbi:metallophosphoesterase [Streptomyces poriferorum]|uniref:Metallophosphoesterase n=1 Tax=Streptomyces poriferorum TaxID=2798799 RepID=A0ABY9INK1_9ACTN|nr:MULTISPECIES: metallophosphoesterase [unclassified Streptomyces]MDP5314220.1 metallophosphoesterase [Streptomyces sp. Alt4]WLQ56852.1 metallophosphoesterase [Streptomyces sp. Alt2]